MPLLRQSFLPLLFGVLLLVGVPALAHTDVETTTPLDGANVDEPLDRVTATFAEALLTGGDHAIAVFGPDGASRVDDDTTVADQPETISVGVTLADAGQHEVRWVIIAEDGDEQRGEFTFAVTEAALASAEVTPTTDPAAPSTPASPTTAPTVSETASSTEGPTPTDGAATATAEETEDQDAADSGGSASSTGLVVVLVVLVILGVGGLVIARRRRS